MRVKFLPLIFLVVNSTSASYNIINTLNINQYDVIREIHMRTYTECKMRCDNVKGCTLIGVKDGNHGELVCLLLKEKVNKDGGLNATKTNDDDVTIIKELRDTTILESQVNWTAKPKVNGQWSRWSTTFPCNVSCGGGIIRMRRVCDCPSPSDRGLECLLSNGTRGLEERLVKSCGAKTCPVDGMYGPWSVYGPCNQTCGGGRQLRNRSCDSPPPSHGGRNCTSLGKAMEVRECNTDSCPGPCHSLSKFVGVWHVSDPTFDDWSIEQKIVQCPGFDGCWRWRRYTSDEKTLFSPSDGWYRARRYDNNKWFYFRQVRDRLSVVYFSRYYVGNYKGRKHYVDKAVGKPTNNGGDIKTSGICISSLTEDDCKRFAISSGLKWEKRVSENNAPFGCFHMPKWTNVYYNTQFSTTIFCNTERQCVCGKGLLGSWKVFWKNKGTNTNKYNIKNDGTLTITTPTQKSFQIKASDNKDGMFSQHDGWCKGYNNDVADKTVIYLRVVDDSVCILEVTEISDNGHMSERFGWK